MDELPMLYYNLAMIYTILYRRKPGIPNFEIILTLYGAILTVLYFLGQNYFVVFFTGIT